MNLDEQLMAKGGETDKSSGRAGDLREAQRAGLNDKTTAKNAAGQDKGDSSASLRETAIAEKKKGDLAADKEKESGGAAAGASMNQGTSKLLRQAWLHLIDSWGLTLIWINIHVFLANVLGEKLFCKLGSEWADMVPGAAGAAAQSGQAEKAKKKIGMIEPMGLACCDLGCLLIIVALGSVIAAIGMVVTDPAGAVVLMGKDIFGIIKSYLGE